MLNDLLAKNQSSDKLYVEDVFSTWLYSGTGSSQTITTGIDLSANAGMVWIKGRSGATDHAIYDTARGVQKDLVTNATSAETTQSTGLTAFSSTGFTIGALAKLNTSAATYASWTFRKEPKFFDVVTWTANGSAQNINHNLGIQPGMIIVKATSGTSNWFVWHIGSGVATSRSGLSLNTTNASAYSFDVSSSITSTSFNTLYINDHAANTPTNNGVTYVAYLFAHDTTADGVIQCGSFTTDGSGNATVNLGWEPQFVLYKSSSNTSNWSILDNMRGMVDGGAGSSSSDDAELMANLANAETLQGRINPTATGFFAPVGFSSRTYIYLAIRRGPMRVPTDATKVFKPVASTNTAGTKQTVGFPVDMQISGQRAFSSSTKNWTVNDRLRGVSTNDTEIWRYLLTSSTAAEGSTNTYVGSRFWDNTSFKTPDGVNNDSAIYHNFARAPGFFDVSCYTGTGSATTVSHNLGVVPELMIVKRRNAGGVWGVYSASIGAGKLLQLENSVGSATDADQWNNTAPTATVFTVGINAQVNASGGTYVAYLFATCAGVSKVGTYTGTGTTKQIDCGFTNGARFVLIKRTDSTGDWYVYDSARGIVAGNDPYLLLNSTAAEVTNTDYVDAYSAGFELSSTAPAALNANGGTYIYLAIA